MIHNLEAIHTHVKSHYGKAQVITDGDIIKLQSYSTIVAEYNKADSELTVHGEYSQTTMRHLKDFINQYTNEYVRNNDDIRKLIK